jgi:hypothetical protein
MAVKWSTKKNELPKIEMSLKSMRGKKVQIGCFEGSHVWLAGIHEYGCNIAVTPAMRAHLRNRGLCLKKGTTQIRIPERAFLRNGHDENAERIITQTERMVSMVIAGKKSPEDMLNECGRQMSTAIKKYAGTTKANHPFTIEQKGSSKPLTGSSGALIEGITWKVEG